MYLELGAIDADRVSFPDCQIGSFVADVRRINFQSDGVFVDGIGFVGPGADVR